MLIYENIENMWLFLNNLKILKKSLAGYKNNYISLSPFIFTFY